MTRWLKNVGYLSLKELRSLFSDPILLVLIAYMFSAALYIISNMPTTELKNAMVAVVDHDRSTLSYHLRDSLLPPQFKSVTEVDPKNVERDMDTGQYTFVLEIPANYERDVLKGENPHIQLSIDATAMTQSSIGSAYIANIFSRELAIFTGKTQVESPINPVIRVLYNPNFSNKWFMGTMQLVGNLNLLILLLVGSAVIRERERGTIEHLLVMPVSASEIAVAKIIANGGVLLAVVVASLTFMVREALGVPILFSQYPIFILGTIVFIFSIASLGILLAIIAPTMPQFGLLCIPTYIVMYMLSGSNSPVENMPELAQQITQFSPTTVFSSYVRDVLFRNAGIDIVWEQLLKMVVMGTVFLTIALIQFKSMLSRQG
ncbi:ABC-2 type transport system permease protein [Pasteurella langaaensis DSM 22999]|uniref:ABC-2 type transport system permease protein n=1 Tax=Alitibacter langaaensis DSM 22999 TaxID=1122935 RepID=A0A2U0TA26_9PAST|nr:ABC transporter permease [Pasteurella langaaensis]PVX40466.1 ABC-2 type transport system permease protein [Pasteurella langaaensis DSM 22999]